MPHHDLYILRMNIARYREMLKSPMPVERRSMVEKLLAESEAQEGSLLATNDNGRT